MSELVLADGDMKVQHDESVKGWGLLANGSSGGWTIEVDESFDCDEWTLEIDGPRGALAL